MVKIQYLLDEHVPHAVARALQPHAGIAYCEQGTRTIGQIIRGLVLIHELLTPDEMVQRVEFL